ncbi:hypothetical protein CM49_05635 [Paenibacillus sp. P1XP2]|nr:hypothetical protein CM49_05635 [Paenibacillus sp. P1XP2]
MEEHLNHPLSVDESVDKAVHERWMKEAIAEAKKAEAIGEVPIARSSSGAMKLSAAATTFAKRPKMRPRMPKSSLSARQARRSALGDCWTAVFM